MFFKFTSETSFLYIFFYFQRSTVDRLTNTQVLMLFIMLIFLCLVSAIFNEIWTRGHIEKDWYIGINSMLKMLFLLFSSTLLIYFSLAVLNKNFGYNLLTFIILYNNLIPISLQVTLELVRFLQVMKHCHFPK